jgi:hypothetical protein
LLNVTNRNSSFAFSSPKAKFQGAGNWFQMLEFKGVSVVAGKNTHRLYFSHAAYEPPSILAPLRGKAPHAIPSG